jgi:hypothetical protein
MADRLGEKYLNGIINWLNDSGLTRSDQAEYYIAKRYAILGRSRKHWTFWRKPFWSGTGKCHISIILMISETCAMNPGSGQF